MGEVTTDTGRTTLRIGATDRAVLLALTFVAAEAALYWADYWFFGGHRVNMALFVILSYAVFRNVLRSLVGWGFFQFISMPPPSAADTAAASPRREATVDVLTTAMPGEPYEMFERTLTAIQAMRHPHTTYLLDGGFDERLGALCRRLGVTHVDCRGVPGAKGGKVNHCLANHARGEFVLVIDPDHIPEPDLLDRVLPCFDHERVGFVQIVQAYYNLNSGPVAYGAAEQTFGFYGPLQMGLDGLRMAIAIGANCTFRRAALDSIGGHAIHLAEDCCTSMRIHAAGWQSRYLPYRGSYGLVPEDLQSFFKQQIKWSKGMFDLLFREYPRLFRSLNLQQRIYYLFAGTFYLGGAVTGLTIILPILFLFLQIYAIEMPLGGFLRHVMPWVIASLVLTFHVQRWYSDRSEHGFPWRAMFLEKGTWHIYTLGLLYSLMNKGIVWVPTPKTASGGGGLTLVLPHAIAVLLSVAAILWPFFAYHRLDPGTGLMMFFAGMNVVSLTPAIFWGLKGAAR